MTLQAGARLPCGRRTNAGGVCAHVRAERAATPLFPALRHSVRRRTKISDVTDVCAVPVSFVRKSIKERVNVYAG